MSYVLSVTMALSIALPAFTGLARYRALQAQDRLFVITICTGLVNELVSLATVKLAGTNAATFNCYTLVECILLMRVFYLWNRCDGPVRTRVVLISLVLVWLFDNVFCGNIGNFYGFFSVYYSVVMMYYSIRHISRSVAFETGNLLLNGRFAAATALLVYFSIKAFTDTFFIIDLGISTVLAQKIVFVSLVINTACNIVHVYAILCMKEKTEFTLGYS